MQNSIQKINVDAEQMLKFAHRYNIPVYIETFTTGCRIMSAGAVEGRQWIATFDKLVEAVIYAGLHDLDVQPPVAVDHRFDHSNVKTCAVCLWRKPNNFVPVVRATLEFEAETDPVIDALILLLHETFPDNPLFQ